MPDLPEVTFILTFALLIQGLDVGLLDAVLEDDDFLVAIGVYLRGWEPPRLSQSVMGSFYTIFGMSAKLIIVICPFA